MIHADSEDVVSCFDVEDVTDMGIFVSNLCDQVGGGGGCNALLSVNNFYRSETDGLFVF